MDAFPRVRLSNGGFEDQGDDFPAVLVPPPGLQDPGTARRIRGDDGLHNVFGVVEGPAQSRCDHVHGFGEADVADFSVGYAGFKFFDGQAGPYFFLKGQAARRGVLDAFNADGPHVVTNARGRGGQEVHEKAGVDAGAENRDPVCFCPCVDGCGQFGLRGPRIGQFFASGNHMDAAIEDVFQCGRDALEF